MPEQVKKSLIISIYFALVVSALLVFWQVRNFDFVNYDDNDYVYANPHVLNGLTAGTVWWAFTTGYAANWHPLTWLSLTLDRQLFGPNPAGFHLTNLFFHIANTLLLFLVLKQMTKAIWQSAFVAAAFALHPMHVESVAWIAERKDVLSTFFWILAMLAYMRYVKQPGAARYLLVLLIFALGLMAKPMLVTLPVVLLLLDYWPLNRLMPQTVAVAGRQKHKSAPAADKNPTFYRIIIEKVPFFVLSVISSIITFLVQRSGGAVRDIDALSLNNRIANTFLSYVRYIGKMFWPQNLAIFYPFDVIRIPFWQIAACAFLVLGISIFVVRIGHNQRYLSLGWFWYLGTLVPVIGIVQVGSHAMADRYTYIALIGLFIIIAWGLPELLAKWIYRKTALGVSMVIILTTLGICAHRQTSYWKNSVTIFSHTIEVTQNNWLAHNNLGNAYTRLGRDNEAIDAYKQALNINPNLTEARTNLGIVYSKLGRDNEAIEAFKQALKIKPDYADAHYSLGIAYAVLSRWSEAIDAFKQAIKINPEYADAHYNLGLAYSNLGRSTEAIDAYQQTIKINPNYAKAYNNLGAVYVNLHRYTEAIDTFKQAIRIKPDYEGAYLNLGVAYLAIGDKNSAMAEYNILKSLNSAMANNLLKEINK